MVPFGEIVTPWGRARPHIYVRERLNRKNCIGKDKADETKKVINMVPQGPIKVQEGKSSFSLPVFFIIICVVGMKPWIIKTK